MKQGLKEAFTSRGRAIAEEMGAIGSSAGTARELEESADLPRVLPMRALKKASGWALKAYGDVDIRNRAIMALGGLRKAEWAAGRAKGNVNRFIDLADADMLRPSETKAIRDLYVSGNKTEAFRRYAIALADDSQYPYTAGTRPQIISGTLGKSFGAFAYWPAYYGDQLIRIASIPGINKKALALSRFAAANGALVGTMGAVASSLGASSPYMRQFIKFGLGPVGWAGSPAIDTTLAAFGASQELLQGQVGGPQQMKFSPVSKKGELRIPPALAPWLPPTYAIRDWEHLFTETGGLARFIGAAPSAPGMKK